MRRIALLLMIMIAGSSLQAATPWSQRMVEAHGLKDFNCNTVYKSSLASSGWDYVTGLVANAVLKTWEMYPEKTSYYSAVKSMADNSTSTDGKTIKNAYGTSALGESNIDDLAAGKMFFALYRKAVKDGNTADATRYRNAATTIRNKLKFNHSRIAAPLPGAGGFWHKASYPNQMWLDGLYMGPAVYAQWQAQFGLTDSIATNTASWSDIALQFKILNANTYDNAKQLNYHGWAADPQDANAFWANEAAPFKGCSPEFWGRSMGWMFAALVDVLELMPANHPDFEILKSMCAQVAAGIKRWQDKSSGVWFQLLQYDGSKKANGVGDNVYGTFYNTGTKSNYLESSCSCMFTYSLFKAVRLGLIDKETYLPTAKKAYFGLINTFISQSGGTLTISNVCASAGLGPSNNLSRTGTVNYYLCGKDVGITQNEGKAIGPFIMASLEYEQYQADSARATGCERVETCCDRSFSVQVPSDGIYLFRFRKSDGIPYLTKQSCKAGENQVWYSMSNEADGTLCEVFTPTGMLVGRKNL